MGDLVIVARTDARQAVDLGEALYRVEAFAEEGADMLLIDALESEEEIKAFAKAAPGTKKVAPRNSIACSRRDVPMALPWLPDVQIMVVHPWAHFGFMVMPC